MITASVMKELNNIFMIAYANQHEISQEIHIFKT